MDPTPNWWITVLAGGGVVAGLVLLARGLIDYRSSVRVGDTSTSAISSLAAGEVRISGVVEAAEMTLVSLLQGVACVYYRATIGRGGDVSPVESGFTEERSIGFRVRDATGAIRVFPRGARFDAAVRFNEETGAMGDEPPGLAIRTGAATRLSELIATRRLPSSCGCATRMTTAIDRPRCATATVHGGIAKHVSSPVTRSRSSVAPCPSRILPTRWRPTPASRPTSSTATPRSRRTWLRLERPASSPPIPRTPGATPRSRGSGSAGRSTTPEIDPAANALPLATPEEAAQAERTFEIAPDTLVLASSAEVPLLIAYGDAGRGRGARASCVHALGLLGAILAIASAMVFAITHQRRLRS